MKVNVNPQHGFVNHRCVIPTGASLVFDRYPKTGKWW